MLPAGEKRMCGSQIEILNQRLLSLEIDIVDEIESKLIVCRSILLNIQEFVLFFVSLKFNDYSIVH